MKIYNWGIIGCGKIAHKFANDLKGVPRANLCAVASRKEEKAKEFYEMYRADHYFGDYQKLMACDAVDIIYIATPHVFHYEQTLQCLQYKKAVLCEKPFGMNCEQVRKMITVAKEQNVFLMEALWTHFLPHYQEILTLVNEGKLGTIRELKADFGFKANPVLAPRIFEKNLGGGSLLDVGIYPLFAALTLLGYPVDISAKAQFSKNDIDLKCSMTLYYPNNVKAYLTSAVNEETPTELQIKLDKGTITAHTRFHEPTSITVFKNNKSKTTDYPQDFNGYQYEAIHVQNMLDRNVKESNIMTFEKSLQLMKLLDEVRLKIGLSYP